MSDTRVYRGQAAARQIFDGIWLNRFVALINATRPLSISSFASVGYYKLRCSITESVPCFFWQSAFMLSTAFPSHGSHLTFSHFQHIPTLMAGPSLEPAFLFQQLTTKSGQSLKTFPENIVKITTAITDVRTLIFETTFYFSLCTPLNIYFEYYCTAYFLAKSRPLSHPNNKQVIGTKTKGEVHSRIGLPYNL